MLQTFQPNRIFADIRESANGSAKHNVVDHLWEGVQEGAYRLGENGLDIPSLFEAMFGYKAQQFLQHEGEVTKAIQESATGVTMSDFKLITAGMILRYIKEASATVDLIGDRLYTVENSVPRPNSQNVPWVGGPTRWADMIIAELEAFPPIAPRNGFLQIPKQNKRGAVCPFSKESLLADRSSVIMKSGKNAVDGGYITREILQLKVALGTTGKWKFGLNDGTIVEYNLYNTAASGPSPLNSLTVLPLNDWTSIDTALAAWRNMRDPVSGEFKAIPKKLTIIVPMVIYAKAQVIRNAVSVNTFNAVYASATIRYDGANPLNYVYPGMQIEIIASPYVDEITGATAATYTWFMGDFPQALLCDQVYGPQFDELGRGSEQSFWKDMDLAIKMSWFECYVPWDPTQVMKIANT